MIEKETIGSTSMPKIVSKYAKTKREIPTKNSAVTNRNEIQVSREAGVEPRVSK
jgi:hypothetical protein